MNRTLSLTIAGVGFVALAVTILFTQLRFASASAPSGLPASVATSSTQVATDATARVLFATSTCAARVITVPGGTGLAGVRLTFSDFKGETPTNSLGVYQAASTTAVYDSGQYGCDLVKVYSYGTQTLYVAESR